MARRRAVVEATAAEEGKAHDEAIFQAAEHQIQAEQVRNQAANKDGVEQDSGRAGAGAAKHKAALSSNEVSLSQW